MSNSQTAVRYRAKFKDLKLGTLAGTEILLCELEMELRPVRGRHGLFSLHYRHTGRQSTLRLFTKHGAMEKARLMFREQLSDWIEVPDVE